MKPPRHTRGASGLGRMARSWWRALCAALRGERRASPDGARAPSRTDEVARLGEQAAQAHLRDAGYCVLARNAVVALGPGREGEVDLIAQSPDGTPTIVEVKARVERTQPARPAGKSGGQPSPLASITQAKRRKLLSLGRRLARANGWARWRIEAVEVLVREAEDGSLRVASVRVVRVA